MNIFSKLGIAILILISLSKFGQPFKIHNNKNNNFLTPQSSLLTSLRNSIKLSSSSKIDFHDVNLHKKQAELLVSALIPSYVQDWVKGHPNMFQNPNGSIPVGEVCFGHLQLLFTELQTIVLDNSKIFNASLWALQMIDSWGKIPEGILSGHVNTYGDWDECVNLEHEKSEFKGRHCWTYLLPTFIPPQFGEEKRQGAHSKAASGSIEDLFHDIFYYTAALEVPSFASCSPSTCSFDEIQAVQFALFSADPAHPEASAFLPFLYYCSELDKPSLSSGAIAMICVLSVMGFFILVGTILDTVLCFKSSQEIRKNLLVQILLAFSLVTNIKKWQNTKSSDGGFGCIHGIRFLSTCWVLLSHTIYLLLIQPASWNNHEINKIYKSHWSMYVIMNGYFSVDTFFTMSGLLACFSILKALDKSGGSINIPKLYIHRYLRLTPTYALLLGILATLYPYMGDGPYFSNVADHSAKSCQDFWWHNVLYINNIIKYNSTLGESMCEGESWYIANDMQFFILSPIFVFLLWKWPKIGMIVLGAASIGSILAPGIAVGTEKLPPTVIIWKSGNERVNDIYREPWYRIGPYLVGIWMGYILFKIGKKPVKLPKLVVIGGWALSTATAAALIFGIIPYYDPENNDSPVWAGIYAGLSRFVWGIVICWIIFACVKGHGGVVNSFLSWKAFIPLGRLTFCVYVSSLSIQMLTHMTIRQPMYFDMYTMVNLFFSHVIMCFLVGFALTMAFESPFIQLEKLLLGSGSGSKSEVKQNPSKIAEDSNGNTMTTKEEYMIPRVVPKIN